MINIAVYTPILNSVRTVLLPDVKIQQLIEGNKNVNKSIKYDAAEQI